MLWSLQQRSSSIRVRKQMERSVHRSYVNGKWPNSLTSSLLAVFAFHMSAKAFRWGKEWPLLCLTLFALYLKAWAEMVGAEMRFTILLWQEVVSRSPKHCCLVSLQAKCSLIPLNAKLTSNLVSSTPQGQSCIGWSLQKHNYIQWHNKYAFAVALFRNVKLFWRNITQKQIADVVVWHLIL